MPHQPKKSSSTRRVKVGTRRIPRVSTRTQGQVEVIAGGEDPATVRRRPHPPIGRKGLPLRWKIIAAIAAVTFCTGIGIFIVVYNKAVDQLNEEINAKGERIVNTLASVDQKYWMKAIHQPDRLAAIRKFLSKIDPTDSWKERIKKERGYQAYKALIESKGGESPQEIRNSIDIILGKKGWYDKEANRIEFYNLIAPFGPLDRLDPLTSLQEGNEDLVDIGVAHVSRGNTSGTGLGGRITKIDLPDQKGGEKITIKDTTRKEGSRTTQVRIFVRNSDGNSDPKLRYYAMLSLEKISDAKATLFWAIFLTVLIAVGGGAGIAVWISTFITNPLKALMRDIQIVSEGDLDHETVSTSKDEIGLLATTFNKMTGALKIAHEQELEQKRMEHQLAVAREIQENLMPKRVLKLPGYDVGAFYRPSQEVGGDYYDFIDIDEDHAGIIVADVSGKGVPGAIVMSMALAFIREEVDRTHNLSPMSTLIRANKMLAQNIKKGMFVTALYCILNKRTHEMKVTSAGHNPLIWWEAAHNRVKLVNPKGIALGFDKGPVFERTCEEGILKLNHGDRIVSYTDGAVEAMNAENEEFGDDRFFKLAQQLATRDSNQFLNILVNKLDEHAGESPQHDDITIVTLRYL